MKDSIKKEALFNSDIDKVWNAISKGEEISKWFLNADFRAEKDYEYTFKSTGEDCTEINGVVKSAAPYLLVYTWVVANTNVETTVSWNLETVNGQTKLTLEHSGIANYGGDTAVTMFESFDGGWDNCINGLKGFVTSD